MRTTLDIDADVLQATKELAAQQGLTAGKVLSDLARKALTSVPGPIEHVSEPGAVYGFQPFPKRGGVVTNELVRQLREKEGI